MHNISKIRYEFHDRKYANITLGYNLDFLCYEYVNIFRIFLLICAKIECSINGKMWSIVPLAIWSIVEHLSMFAKIASILSIVAQRCYLDEEKCV